MTTAAEWVAFLNARLDEDEETAKAAEEDSVADWFLDPFSEDDDERTVRYTGPSTLRPGATWDYPVASRVSAEGGAHIARHDPARTLREVAAKRALIRDLLDSQHYLNDREWYGCEAVTDGPVGSPDVPTGRECTCGRDDDVERRLALLGAVYSDHSDYPKG